MTSSDMGEFYRWFYNESVRLENLFAIKWNNIFLRKTFDTLDLLDMIEVVVQMQYLSYVEERIQLLMKYLHDYC